MTNHSVLGPDDLREYMERGGISGEIVYLDVPTPTVETAAAAVGVQPDQIVKSLLFLVKDEFVLAVTCGVLRVEKRVLARKYDVGRKKVELADAETVFATIGYPVGTVPPFGHRTPIPTLLDPRVLMHDEVYAGGGGENALVRLKSTEIQKYCEAEVLDLHTWSEN